MIIQRILACIIFLSPSCIYAEEMIKKDVHVTEVYFDINCGGKNGLVSEYYEDGSLKTAVMCVEGKREGAYKSYYPNGFLEKIIVYRADMRDGDFKKYYENGKLAHEWKFQDGKKVEGYVRQCNYYDNGNLKLEYYYNGGEGFRNQFYENGQLSSRLVIKFGKAFKNIEYNKEGRLQSEKFLFINKQ